MKKNTLIKNTAILLIAMVITKVIGAVFKIPLANILGGKGMGYYSAAYGLFGPVFAITAAGIPTAMINLVSANVTNGRFCNARKVKRIALRFFSLIGLIGTIAIIILAYPFSNIITNQPESFLPILFIAPTVLLCCAGSVYRGYFEGLNNMRPTAIVHVAEAVARAVFGLAFAYGAVYLARVQFLSNGVVFGVKADSYQMAEQIAIPYSAGAAILGVTISEVVAFLYLFIRGRYLPDGVSKAMLDQNTQTDSVGTIIKSLIRESLPIAISSVVMNFMSFIDLLTVPRGIANAVLHGKDYFLSLYTHLRRRRCRYVW